MDMSKAAADGDKTTKFVLEQVTNFEKVRPTWEEPTLGECMLWKATSSKGYDLVRGRKLLRLPCQSTLQKFVGSSTGDWGHEPHQRTVASREGKFEVRKRSVLQLIR